jgi:hypothetical protein
LEPLVLVKSLLWAVAVQVQMVVVAQVDIFMILPQF